MKIELSFFDIDISVFNIESSDNKKNKNRIANKKKIIWKP